MPEPIPWARATSRVVGVMGHPIDHSLSPLLHNTAFAELGIDWVSVAFPVVPGAAAGALAGARDLGLAGLSVTMPHKAAVAAAVDRLSPLAARLEAVNCVVLREGRATGENTDGGGFVDALGHGAGFAVAGRRCLVAGAGGAARAVVVALAEAGASEVAVVNRTPERARAAAALAGAVGRVGQAAEASGMDLVVDATPVGMGGAGTAVPTVDPTLLGPSQLAVDLVYHPRRTPWLTAAAEQGATVLGGLGMLVHQAARQLELWTGLDPPTAVLWQAAMAATGD
ncbi:MAG TPA: shikimate dehydrogenase [Acidimicrobiales bacterium]